MNIKHFFYWVASGIALIALAGPEPDLATMLVVLIIIGVILRHYKEYFSYINTFTPNSVKKG